MSYNVDDLINWTKLSEHLSGGKSNVSRRRVPRRYLGIVNALRFFMRMVLDNNIKQGDK